MIGNADIVIDLQAGDTGKGKVSDHLAKNNNYDAVLRFNGGGNAGHTIYHDGVKIVTHQVPVGIFYNIPSIIGAGCVVNISKLNEEISMLRSLGYNGKVFVDQRAHVTMPEHIDEDTKDVKLGTTGQGIGPTYRDKVARTGKRIADVMNPYERGLFTIIDTYNYFYNRREYFPIDVLCEGAQGFQIDLDWGDYPYVTSSSCTSASVQISGIAPRYWRNVYGIMKAYETYSGHKTHFASVADVNQYLDVFNKIQEIGGEIGATTGRKRHIRWLQLDGVIQAMYINNVTNLIINKVDVLDAVKTWVVNFKNQNYVFNSSKEFKEFVENTIMWNYHHTLNEIVWSTKKEGL